MNEFWDAESESGSRTIDVYMRKLREKFECCKDFEIVTVHGLGYKAVQMIWQNRSYEYKGYIIYISALYAFYCLINAVVNVVKFSKRNNAILSAAKILALAGALMSMFALQTAMFSAFGGGEELQRLMNTITGGAVCLIVMGMAVFMIVRANIYLKKLENEKSERSVLNG